jgi:hypothetical protein
MEDTRKSRHRDNQTEPKRENTRKTRKCSSDRVNIENAAQRRHRDSQIERHRKTADRADTE